MKKYKTIVEEANDGIIVVNNGLIQFANHKVEELTGHKVEDIINTPFFDLIHPLSSKFYEEWINHYDSSSNNAFICEVSLKKKDGDPLKAELSVKQIEYEKLSAALIIIRDLSARIESRKHMIAFMEAAPVAFYLFNPDLYLLYANETAKSRFRERGRQSKIINAHITNLVPNIEKTERYRKYIEVLETSKPIQIDFIRGEYPFEKQYFSIRAFKVGNNLGVISTDITERVKIKNALLKTKKQLEDTFDNTPASIYLKDLEGRFLFVNRVWCEKRGFQKSEIIGKTESELLTNLSKEKWQENEKIVLLNGQAQQFEEVERKTGQTYLSTKFLLYDEQGKAYALCSSSLDITDRKQNEEKIKRIKREEELYHTMLSHFMKNDFQKVIFSLEFKQNQIKGEDDQNLDDIIAICQNASKTIDRVNTIYSVLQADFKGKRTNYNLLKTLTILSLTSAINIEFECEKTDVILALDDYFIELLSEIFLFISEDTDEIVSSVCSWNLDNNDSFKISIEENHSDPLPNDLCNRISLGVTEKWESLGHYSGLTLASVIAQYYGGKLIISPSKMKGNKFYIILPSNLVSFV
ncbi:MAG: PAS domain-containing protein [Candidatus Hodarchaeales archaeon]